MKTQNKSIIEKIVSKDYNNQLEEILSKKLYEEDVKNLLLDILYRVETSYKDYIKVKVNGQTQEQYIKNIIDTIKNKCDTIKFVKPNGTASKGYILRKENKEIICYPILIKILYALAQMQKSEDIIKNEDELLIKCLSDLVVIGNNINTVEPLRDFNGFSWNIITSDIENVYYNLIYQDLIILNGNKFLEECANKNKTQIDYMEKLENDLSQKYGQKTAESILELIKRLSVLIEINSNTAIVKEIIDEKSEMEKELSKIKDSTNYIIEITEKKKKLLKTIKRIDIILNNEELLKKEYDRRNKLLPKEKKIFSPKVLAKKFKEERNNILRKIEELNILMNPKKMMERQQKLEQKLKYRKLIEINDMEKEIVKDIIELQKIVIKCIREKLKYCEDKNSLMKFMYELRYFCQIPVIGKETIEDISELSKMLDITQKGFWIKANSLNMINTVSDNEELNMSICKHIFSSKIISLEDISLKIMEEKDGWYIQFFDEGVTDEAFKIDINLKKEDIKIKLNKKIKIFNNKN